MNARGISLIEAILAIVILTLTILALGLMFSTGKGNLTRLAWRRAALAEAQSKMEYMTHGPVAVTDTTPGTHALGAPLLDGTKPATTTSRVWWEADPGSPGTLGNKRVRVVVQWRTAIPESVSLESFIPPY